MLCGSVSPPRSEMRNIDDLLDCVLPSESAEDVEY